MTQLLYFITGWFLGVASTIVLIACVAWASSKDSIVEPDSDGNDL